jgi:hypothetical protein
VEVGQQNSNNNDKSDVTSRPSKGFPTAAKPAAATSEAAG